MTENLLRATNITQRFGGLTAVDNVNFELNRGEVVGIIGPNGAGKTTFFNVLTGMYDPTEGKVYFKDRDITGMKPFEITEYGLARTFQNIRLFSGMTVLENVMVGLTCRTKANLFDAVFRTPRHRNEEAAAEKRALEILEITGLADFRYHYATSLPYGLQRRLEIARAIASDPAVLLLDEPAAGMNEQETTDLMEFILKLKGLGYSILLIEHDMRFVMSICERIYVLNHGKLIAEGKPQEIKADPLVIEAYLGSEV